MAAKWGCASRYRTTRRCFASRSVPITPTRAVPAFNGPARRNFWIRHGRNADAPLGWNRGALCALMRILHILDHSLPLQSGYVYRTLGIVDQQRALGWEPVLLTSGKHYAPGPARERIGEWEFLRTPRPNGLAARLPWVRELKIVSDLGRRLDDVVAEVRPDILHAHSPVLNAWPAIRAARRNGLPVVYEVRSLWEDAVGKNGAYRSADLRYHAARL